MRRAWLVLCLLALSSCDSPPPTTPDPAAPLERGPKAIALDGDPNGLFWDAASQTLYIADDQNNRVLKWTDAEGVTLAAQLPPAPGNGPGLGDLVRMPDGTLVVVRFGGGTAGDVVFVRPDGTTGTVPGLKPERRRIGLSAETDPVKVEHDLMRLVPRKEWTRFSHRMIFHGRQVCHSRKPDCEGCALRKICPKVGVPAS